MRRFDMALKKPSCTVGEAGEPEAVPVVPFLALTVLAGDGFAIDGFVEEEGVEVVLELWVWEVKFETDSTLEDETEEGLVGEMAGVALGEAVLENAEDKGLDVARVSCLEQSDLFPLVHLDWVPVTNADSKVAEHAGEEFEVCEDNSVDEDIIAQFDDDELALGRALEKHVRVLVLNENGLGVLCARTCLENGGTRIKRRI
ncbi:hypothetical protein HG531_007464 [Fusarium graminearum]|nr:hypothetical protein HG531_007464 [Fusarium graminearum]